MRHDSGPVPGATLKATSPSKGNHKMAKLFMMSTKEVIFQLENWNKQEVKRKKKENSNGKVYLIGGLIFEIESI